MLSKYIDGYIFTKGLSTEELAEFRASVNPKVQRP